jgi:hypothetical protein
MRTPSKDKTYLVAVNVLAFDLVDGEQDSAEGLRIAAMHAPIRVAKLFAIIHQLRGALRNQIEKFT